MVNLSTVNAIKKNAEALVTSESQLVGAVGGDTLEKMVAGALDASAMLMQFATYFINNNDLIDFDKVLASYEHAVYASRKLQESKSQVNAMSLSEESIFVDPYESEYLPADLMTEDVPFAVTESVKEDLDVLPDELDDDPDAVITTDPDGMPVKFNNSPVELDPFAVRLFRNNADLIDPPEVFQAIDGAEDSVEPEIEPGAATDDTVDNATTDQVIDVIADGPEEKKEDDQDTVEINVADVELPNSDFDVFANESVSVPKTSTVIPKATEDGLPPQFSATEAKRANDNIAMEPGNNLRMLEFLAQDW